MSATAVPADLVENLGAVLDKARAEGAAAERAAVVAWLRQAAENHGCCDHFGDALFDAAKQVEQGAHREPRK